MAKVAITVTLKNDLNQVIPGGAISSGDKNTFTEAKDAVANTLAARKAASQADVTSFEQAEGAFNQ
jgi:hypothetical protein